MPRILLQGLDIPDELHERTMGELQGGQKVRVLLAQALFGHPQALLLDEPTNHLDLDSIHWLQDFLNDYDGVLIVISHDRHFLNSVCTHIADIDYETIITYTGSYDEMVMAKTQIRSQIEGAERAAGKEDCPAERIHRAFFGRNALQPGAVAAQGSGAPAGHGAGEVEHSAPFLEVRAEASFGQTHSGTGRASAKSYGDKEVIKSFTASVLRGEKIALDGPQRRGQNHAAECAAGQLADDS